MLQSGTFEMIIHSACTYTATRWMIMQDLMFHIMSSLQIPPQCLEHNNAALTIIHYLTDSQFLGNSNPENKHLTHANIILRTLPDK